MVHLHTHVRWCTRAQWTMGGLLVAILLVFYIFGYRPQTQFRMQLQARIAQGQSELRDNRTRTCLLPAVASQVRELRDHIDPSRQLPPHQQLPQFYKDITALSQQSALRDFTIKPGAESHGELFSQKPISLSFEGNYVDVFNFLRRAEDMQRLTRIGTMSIKDSGSDPETVQVQLSMNIYFEPD